MSCQESVKSYKDSDTISGAVLHRYFCSECVRVPTSQCGRWLLTLDKGLLAVLHFKCYSRARCRAFRRNRWTQGPAEEGYPHAIEAELVG